MSEYHKIDTVFKRDPATKHKSLLIGEYSQDAFAYLANNDWEWTEKVDGTNIRIMVMPLSLGGQIAIGGRTDAAQIPAFLLQAMVNWRDENRDAIYRTLPDGGVLYGEGYGARIQKGGGNYRADVGFVLFDVRVGEWWLQRSDVEDVAEKLSLDIVPIIGHGTLADMVELARNGFNSQWGSFTAEGIVARPAVELKTRAGKRVITKIKHRDFVFTDALAAE